MDNSILIKIPQRYTDRFNAQGEKGGLWRGLVLQFIRNTQDYMSQAPYFFPEYTKHTVEHINSVLELSAKLIPTDTMQNLETDAVAILIMSIITHDIGMFIKPDGLACLLEQEPKTDTEEPTWQAAWAQYQSQLNHYSDRELEKHFGNPAECADDVSKLTQLPDRIDANRLTQWQIRLCGEFLRKMHPRLAQEIVEDGFPGQKRCDLFANMEIDPEYRTLIGITARSHGMDLNDVVPMLRIFDEAAPAYPYELPIFYLMGILRMADYLDAGRDRAPHAITAMQHFESELSYDEFKWNQLVTLENRWGKTAYERLFIHVNQTDIDSRTFLKVEEWLKSLQRELDVCWRQISLHYQDDYRFTIRQIDSPILQESSRRRLERSIVIQKAQLRAAPEILELLVAPLYGGDAKYGVRELLQNAVDACRERKTFEKERGNNSYQGTVWLELNSECEQPYFSIRDNGCGMEQDVILNYFLAAGNSYRNSTQWKEQFESKNIKRSGRFGIGVLASFLLGRRIEVETKPLSGGNPFYFEINQQNYEQINIFRTGGRKKCLLDGAESGTCIRIDINQKLAEEMARCLKDGKASYLGNNPDWTQWFWMQEPEVKYIINGKEWDNPYGLPGGEKSYGLQENHRWFKLPEVGPFDQIWWTPEEKERIWCNGIFICGEDKGLEHYIEHLRFSSKDGYSDDTYDFCLQVPSLSIVDSKNALNLSLSRNEVQDFPEDIRHALYLENCKLALSLLVLIDFSQQKELLPTFPFGIKMRPCWMEHLLFCKKGYSLPGNRVLQRLTGQMIWLLYRDGRWSNLEFEKLEGIVSLLHYEDHIDYEHSIQDGIFNSFYLNLTKGIRLSAIHIQKGYINNFLDESPSAKLSGERTFSEKVEYYADIEYEDRYDLKGLDRSMFHGVDNFLDELEVEDRDREDLSTYYKTGKFFPYVQEIAVGKQHYLAAAKKETYVEGGAIKALLPSCAAACGYQVLSEDRNKIEPLEKLLDEYLGGEIWIPYDISERRKRFPRFFDPNDEMYQYAVLVGQQAGFYDVRALTKDL